MIYCRKPSSTERKATSSVAWLLFLMMNLDEVFMSNTVCNAPFCLNSRNPNLAWCGEHRWEREKYKVKFYKELLPLWAIKRCPVHGFLRPSQVYVNPSSKQRRCRSCDSIRQKSSYCPIKQKKFNIKAGPVRQESRLKKRYGISSVDYHLILTKQNNSCAICKITIDQHQSLKGKKRFSVDHCHKTGQVRGLLCYRCNMGLGYFKDDPDLTQAATAYLVSY